MKQYRFETLQIHVGQEMPDPATDARAVPIYATASYVFHDCAHAAARFGLEDPGNIYGRLTNSTQEVLEKRAAALEGGTAALALASGAAAIAYTLQALGQNGGHFVAQKTIYGGSYNLMEHTLPGFGITASFVNIQGQSTSKPWEIPTATSPISTRWRPLPTDMAFLLLWTIPSAHRISSVPSSTERILWYIPLQNFLGAMARPLEASLWIREISTGLSRGSIRPLQSRTQAITVFPS